MKGYVALTTVLVILPLLLLSGINSLYGSMTSLIIGKMNYDCQILKSNSETCLEESVYRIKRNVTLTGSFDISMDNWVCTITVTDKVGSTGIKVLNIVTTDNVNSVSIVSNKELNINTDPFEISNI